MNQLEQYLSVENSGRGEWLDNENVVFINNKSGVPQIWQKSLSTGETRQRTFYSERIFRVQTHMDTRSIIFCMDEGGNEQEQIYLLKDGAEEPVNLTNNPEVRHYLGGMTNDGKKIIMSCNARKRASFDICSIDVETGEIKTILQNEDNYNLPACLSPNGQYLLYNKLLATSDNALWMVDVNNGKAVKIPEDDTVAQYVNPTWRSDSKGFYLLTDREDEYTYVAYYDIETKSLKPYYKTNWDIEAISLSSDNRYLVMLINEDGYSSMKIMDTKNGIFINHPIPPLGVISYYESITWSQKGHKLLFSLTSGKRTSDLWILDIDNDSLKRITNSSMADLNTDVLVEPELKKYKSFDGLEVPFWLYTPVGKSPENLPVVIEIHGGPEGQERPIYNPLIQYLLNEGIAVVAPNVRGSIGYGKSYHHLDDVEKRLDSVKDIDSLVEYIVNSNIADKNKIAVMGTSYGGYMTLSSLSRYPHLWACGIDIVGMFNLETFMENTAEYRRAHRGSEYGTLEHHREILREVSPIRKVDDITAPLMVVHGANDPRVPVGEAEQVVDCLAKRGVSVKYLRYEDEGHGISKMKNKLHCYPQMAEFLKRNLGIK
ncbi:S9 family peptidase [Clostridium polynesiense]|uniref:S9 family peptidase n=1 Tax=Clostridium polynesiense TaxID=1325933 RepID=UPI00058ACF0D|nr:prolyl oligopeptidase family serine peptidase [Clostridium polynesiense]